MERGTSHRNNRCESSPETQIISGKPRFKKPLFIGIAAKNAFSQYLAQQSITEVLYIYCNDEMVPNS
jgi:hypothetical protein